ncbi:MULTISPECIES: hypothetical protein [Streptomyces]|uniref:hypothetical protein n=1 Tax=Streptomyces TaxID=1883 RepID=UPI00365583EC
MSDKLDAGELNAFISWLDLTLGNESVLKLTQTDDAEVQDLLDRYYRDKKATGDFRDWSRSTEPGRNGFAFQDGWGSLDEEAFRESAQQPEALHEAAMRQRASDLRAVEEEDGDV